MQNLRSSILCYTRIRVSMIDLFRSRYVNGLNSLDIQLHPCSSFSGASNDQIMDRVIRLVKKFSKIDSSKVNVHLYTFFSISVISKYSQYLLQ